MLCSLISQSIILLFLTLKAKSRWYNNLRVTLYLTITVYSRYNGV